MTAEFIFQELFSVANPEKARFLQGFFKTGKGQYAEGDVFLGIVVPQVRDIVKNNKGISFPEIQKLLDSEYHEARLAGLLFLVQQFKKSKKEEERKKIFDFYLKNARKANNWDLVDVTCRDVIGGYLLNKGDRDILYKLAESDNLWEQRIAIVSTWMFIKHKDYTETLALSEKLLNHKHDLMHKAVGWMLREVGKKDKETLTDFLEIHHKNMPRTSLRYAIEHFSPEEKAHFMKK
ncbi:DNA alkylation repair protein [Bacteroidia bacterium]|nr:DNA alkylation repair protein [Bacteroidia bacterium]GHU87381.1 DNA alkylation repair protein [Bacteroidia bacterium]